MTVGATKSIPLIVQETEKAQKEEGKVAYSQFLETLTLAAKKQ